MIRIRVHTPRTGDSIWSDVVGIKLLIACSIVLPAYIPAELCDPRHVQDACVVANLLWLWRF